MRFRREARAAASVSHPHACQIFEIGEDTGRLFIAMELLDGEPLAERLKRGPLPVAEALSLGREMLSALGALHAQGVVHRDLKPSNAFLTPHGTKLLDFGLARSLPTDSSGPLSLESDLTRSGLMVGTPRYGAGADPGGRDRRAHRRLRGGGGPLRGPGGASRLPGDEGRGGHAGDPARAATGPRGVPGGRSFRSRDPAGPGQISRGPLPYRGGHVSRPRGHRPRGLQRVRGSRPRPHPARGPALPRAAPRPRDRLPGPRPGRCSVELPERPQLPRRPLERRRLPLCDRGPRPFGHRHPTRRGPRPPGYLAALGGPPAGLDPARGGSGGDPDLVLHHAV